MPDATAVPNGYTLVMPPGWGRIPLREGTDEVVRRIVEDAVGRLPADIPRDRISEARMELFKRLRKSCREARDNAGIDLYMPVEEMHGVTVAASFVVSEVRLESVVAVDPAHVAAKLLADAADAQPVAVDGAMGVRTDRVAAPDPEREIEHGTRRVDYVLSVPGDPGRWVTVGFSTLADGRPEGEFGDLLTELFDAVMTTFRWSRA